MNNRLTEFLLPELGVRGAIVEFESGVDTMLGSRPYPEAVRQLLAQAVAAMPLLASHTKLDGRISLQFQSGSGHGAVQLLVAQIECGRHGGEPQPTLRVRGMAKSAADASGGFVELLQGGQLGLLLEPDNGGQTYQALVPIEGRRLSDALEFYFAQSEQLPTRLRLAYGNGQIRGLLLQRLPLSEIGSSEDNWQHAEILFATLQETELAATPALTVLRRLFHAETLRVFDAQQVQLACRCSRDGIAAMLLSLGAAEIEEHLREHEGFEVTCEFCGREYRFSGDEARGLFLASHLQPSNQTRH